MPCFRSYTLALLLCALAAGGLAAEERIVGGIIARKKYRRHLAQVWIVTSAGTLFCTGSVLSNRYILTAAHCFDTIAFERNLVRDSYLYVGLRTANPGGNKKWYAFETLYIHKRYNPSDYTLRNDVAVIKLTENIPSGKTFPVRLAKAPAANKVVVAAGYGALNEDGQLAKYAMQTRVIHKSFQECKSSDIPFFRSKLKKKYHVCAVSLGYPNQGRTDTCYGDSGGPLFSKSGVQFGITSFSSQGCAEPGGIPWYARVSSYKSAIEKVVSGRSSGAFDRYT